MVLETLEFGWEKKTNIYTYAIRWPRVPGKFFYHVLGHPVNSLNRHLCDKNKVSVFESFHPPKEESERKRLTTFLV